MDSFKDLLVILSSDICDNGANICFECVSISEASLEVGLVIIASETSNETSNEVSGFDCIECEVCALGGCIKG